MTPEKKLKFAEEHKDVFAKITEYYQKKIEDLLNKDEKAALAEIFLKQGITHDFCNLLKKMQKYLKK